MRTRALLLPSCVLLLLGLVGKPAHAVPNTVTFTANVADSSGPIDGAVTMTFKVFDDLAGGTLIWEETQSLTADNGLVFAELGAVDPIANGLDENVFNGSNLWLDLTVNGDPQLPRIPIVSVPYAVRAEVADRLGDLAPGDVALGSHDHDGTYLREGATLSCPGATPVVTGLEAATGNVICRADEDTTYSAGTGIQISGSTISADLTELSSPGTINDPSNPVDWSRLKSVPAGFADGSDDNTTYSPGTGLGLLGTTFSAQYAGSGGDFGSSAELARGDHMHDARYATETELSSIGTINDASNPVDWSRLKSVPDDFADGTDDDTTYAPGNGLNLAGTTFVVVPADFSAPVVHNSETGGLTFSSGSGYQTIRQLTISTPVAGQVSVLGLANARCDTAGCGLFINTAGSAGWDTDESGAPAFAMNWRARGSGGGSATVSAMYTFSVPAGSSTFYFRADCAGPDSCAYGNRQVMGWFTPQ